MYKQYLLRDNKKVITTMDIKPNMPILEFSGSIFKEKDLPADAKDYLQIGPNIYLGLSGDIEDKIRHSCNPNCMLHIVGNRAILYSLYLIPANMELTFDYSTSSTDTYDKWKMDCKCGQFNCRKLISGFDYLEEDKKAEYNKKGMIPIFIANPIFMKK